jgi:hypothetical protein
METLFGRFPHLVENIFGLLNGKTLSYCCQINDIWNENIEEYRFYLVKKIQKHVRNQNIVNLQTECPTIQWRPMHLERIVMVEELPLPFLDQCLRNFCDFNCGFIFNMICAKKTSVLVGVFIKNLPNGGRKYTFSKKNLKKIQVESRKISGDTLEASEITNNVCTKMNRFFKCPVSSTYHSGNSLY